MEIIDGKALEAIDLLQKRSSTYSYTIVIFPNTPRDASVLSATLANGKEYYVKRWCEANNASSTRFDAPSLLNA